MGSDENMKRGIVLSLFVGGALVVGILGPWVGQQRYIYTDIAQVPDAPVAIVFGAAVYPGGRPSPVLADRVETAVDLYKAGKVRRLLLSGDNRFENYNEPGAMLTYAHQLGVPREAMQPDYAGRRTYDTCYRARYIFQVKKAILVTQKFHLPRALFICRSLGIDAVGVAADRRPYPAGEVLWWNIRESMALLRSLFDVIRRQEAAVMGPPIPIEP